MKESLEKKYVDKTITDIELNQYKKILWIKKSLILGLFLFILVFSSICAYRVNIFFNVLGRGSFSFYSVSIVLFYLTLFLCFGYFSFQMGYMIYSTIVNKDFLELITKLNIKLDIVSFLCKCLAILLFIMIYITTPCNVVGNSMNNTLQEGDRLLCTDLFYSPKKDDIIVFDASDYTTFDKFFIKRIVAVEGDRIIRSGIGVIYINNDEYSDISLEDFSNIRTSAGYYNDEVEFIIPEGKILVMGDNRASGQSHDSRDFGLIDRKAIIGKVYFRLFPFSPIHKSYNYKIEND